MSNKTKNLHKLCICAVLAAMYVALEVLSMQIGKLAFMDNYQLPLGCFPLIIASVMFGPLWGTATGVVGSFLSQVVGGYGITWSSLLWMMPTIAYSLVVAVLYLLFKKSDKTYILAIELTISSLILSFSNTAAMFLQNYITNLSNALLQIFLPFKLIMAIVFAVIFALLAPQVIKRIKKIIK